MSRVDRVALLLSLLAILVTYFVTLKYSEGIPHIEDEIAYVWQAEAIAGGKLTVPSPPSPDSFLVPFVVDYDGQRFGKYPLGWPVVLAIGVRFGIRALPKILCTHRYRQVLPFRVRIQWSGLSVHR